jgi:hydrogenase nickel incorporation protein HypB
MCMTCGCSEAGETQLPGLQAGNATLPDHDHEHHHDHPHASGERADVPQHVESRPTARRIRLERDVLAKNARLAEHNRDWLQRHRVVAWNLMGSPGAGKTTLLERTVRALGAELPISVIEGDQATLRDAERIGAAGGRVVQINTGNGCHLDAAMVAQGLRQLEPPAGSLLLIENVGNLVCPALFDLGEQRRVVLHSVTEGEDKALKYPHMFRAADLLVLAKIDLLPHVDFDVDRCLGYARRINPRVEIVRVSAFRGDGLDEWYALLRRATRETSSTHA